MPNPSIRWIEVAGTFCCPCGKETYLNDCMLPASHVCDHCGRFYTINYQVRTTKYPPHKANCRMCGDEFYAQHIRGSKTGSYLQTCSYCRKGPKLDTVARKLGVSKQRVYTKLKVWRGQNPAMKRADVLRLMMERV